MKIYIWGTGRLTGMVIGRYISIDEIEGFIDNDESKKEYMKKKVIHPVELLNLEYDAILVANLYSNEIKTQCEHLGINCDKVIYLYNNCTLYDINKDYEYISSVVGKEFADVIQKRHHIIRGVDAFGDLCFRNSVYDSKGYLESDYVRIKCFELAVKELRKRKVAGSVAEVGVFRGEFAQYINYAFPDRKCYLFDTFNGFDATESKNEIKNGNCTDSFVEAYKQTNVKTVLDRMTYLDTIVIVQGLFPQSLNGLEDTFAFVSVDVDFENSIYECVKYFYPRLNKGGYLFVHDYNSDLQGVEKAIDRYEKDNDLMLCKMPLPDKSGTLVITK